MIDLRNRVVEAMARAIAGADAEDYMEDCCRYDKQASASLTALLSELDAAGWQIVPKDPVRLMWAAAGDVVVLNRGKHHDVIAEGVWTGMLAAAPNPFKPEDAA